MFRFATYGIPLAAGRITTALRFPLIACSLLVLLGSLGAGAGAAAEAEPPGRSLVQALAPFLGQPFRADGAQDEEGRWVSFNRPDQVSPEPGFNCSGFVVAAARVLLDRAFSLAEAVRDRQGDSGPDSPLGQDWDFGLDLILNLAETRSPVRRLAWNTEPPESGSGWGVNLHGPDFEAALKLLQPGRFAFFCLSRPDRRFPAGVSYYHVGLIIPEPPDLWLYHSTKGRRTHRLNLADPSQLAGFRRHFPPPARGERRVFLLEVAPPARAENY